MTQQAIQWFYVIEGQRFGPYDTDEMLQRASEGFFHWDIDVWRDGMAGYAPINTVPEFSRLTLPDPPKSKAWHVESLLQGIASLLLLFVGPVLGVASIVSLVRARRAALRQPRRRRRLWLAYLGLALSILGFLINGCLYFGLVLHIAGR